MKILNKILMRVINRLTPSCDIITKKISESLDHKISFRDHIKIRLHIMVCEFCARFRKQMLLIHKSLDQEPVDYSDVFSDIKLTLDQKQRLKSALKNHHH